MACFGAHRDPVIFFKSLKKILKKDAILIIEIPNRDSFGFRLAKDKWFHLDTPRHLFFYNFASLKKILANNQLKIVDYFGELFNFPHDLAFSTISKKITSNNFCAKVTSILLVPILLLLRFGIALFFPKTAEINTYIIKNK